MNNMTQPRLYLAALLTLILSACSGSEQIKMADGSQTQLSHWDDRWLVINYWAEWCGPCRHEIPELNKVHQQRVSSGIVMLGVNYDGIQPPKLNDVISRMEIEFPVLLSDPQVRFGYDRAEQLPMTIVLSPEREVHEVLLGPQTAQAIMAALP